jgi:ubiquinone/menaquinone biosynthesis C-methylase UbiE
MIRQTVSEKKRVHDFWDEKACGEDLYLESLDAVGYSRQADVRYELEPYIPGFAGFDSAKGRRVLEIGVGLGADHQRFAEKGAELWGIDLTERAVSHTRRRLGLFGLHSNLAVGDAESLDFPDGFFDIVYSWGVIHHSPDTPKAVAEIHRVLKPGRTARVMVYHRRSMVGFMLWMRYAFLKGRPFKTLDEVYSEHLESPGTKAYSRSEAKEMFASFRDVDVSTVLTHGDLLESEAGQRHRGLALALAKRLWPRRLIRRFFPNAGLFMMIRATK